ncbi:hypothetical protein [Streptomyces sp. NPDC047000]
MTAAVEIATGVSAEIAVEIVEIKEYVGRMYCNEVPIPQSASAEESAK